jgi:hypothetical protein
MRVRMHVCMQVRIYLAHLIPRKWPEMPETNFFSVLCLERNQMQGKAIMAENAKMFLLRRGGFDQGLRRESSYGFLTTAILFVVV